MSDDIRPGPRANMNPSPHNDGVPIDLLRPVLARRDLSPGARGVWSILVDSYWFCEANRTVLQLADHSPWDVYEIERLLGELVADGLAEILVTPDGVRLVSINPDRLGHVSEQPELPSVTDDDPSGVA